MKEEEVDKIFDEISIPFFGKEKVVSVNEKPFQKWGIYKRTVKISVKVSKELTRAVLKLIRPVEKHTVETKSKYEQRDLAILEYKETLFLHRLCPDYFPKPIGVYRHKKLYGVVVEEIFGEMLYDEHAKKDSHITKKQCEIFISAMEALISKLRNEFSLELSDDVLGTWNLMVGSSAGNQIKRIICIDPELFFLPDDEREDEKLKELYFKDIHSRFKEIREHVAENDRT